MVEKGKAIVVDVADGTDKAPIRSEPKPKNIFN